MKSSDMVLCCPKCGSENLEPYGSPSPLDGKRGRKCLACGQRLAPRRNRLVLGGIMVGALAVMAACTVIAIAGYERFYMTLGVLAGLGVIIFSVPAMFAQMPLAKVGPAERGSEKG